MSEFDHLPFVDPLQGAIQRFKVDPPTDEMREAHRAEVARITGEDPDLRRPTVDSVEAGLRESAIVTFDVPKPTPKMLAAHRAIVASMEGSEVGDLDSRRNTKDRAMKAVRSVLFRGRVTL